MFKKFIVLILSVLYCQSLFSQDQWQWDVPVTDKQEKDFTIAVGGQVCGGLAFGSKPILYDIDFQSGLAYQLGGVVNLHFGRRKQGSPKGTGWIGAETGIMFGTRNIHSRSHPFTFRCLEIPVLAQIYPMPSLAIEAGATLVKIIKCSPDFYQFDDMVFQIGDLSGGDIVISLGTAYHLSNGLSFGLRYNQSTSNLAGNFDSKISFLTASIAFLFPIVK